MTGIRAAAVRACLSTAVNLLEGEIGTILELPKHGRRRSLGQISRSTFATQNEPAINELFVLLLSFWSVLPRSELDKTKCLKFVCYVAILASLTSRVRWGQECEAAWGRELTDSKQASNVGQRCKLH